LWDTVTVELISQLSAGLVTYYMRGDAGSVEGLGDESDPDLHHNLVGSF